MRRFLSVVVGTLVVATVSSTGVAEAMRPVAGASPTVVTTTVRYGPYTIPAASGSMMGEIQNQVDFGVTKPCGACYLTSMKANLVDASGMTLNVDMGLVLHHIVLTDSGRSDATCAGTPLGQLGQRFFASGNERTPVKLPPGYGYYVRRSDAWNMISDLMNMNPTSETVYVKVRFTYSTTAQTRVTPAWLDINECGNSEYTIPAGLSDTHWDWTVNVPGRIVFVAGHIHNDGVDIRATNATTGRKICDSVATYGGTPGYIDMMGMPWISTMSSCAASPVARVLAGQTVRIDSIYDSPTQQTDVMGIMVAYIA